MQNYDASWNTVYGSWSKKVHKHLEKGNLSDQEIECPCQGSLEIFSSKK